MKTSDLEAAIDRVVESYTSPDPINNLESAAMPNRRAVIEAYHHLTPVIYMGFYATRSLSADSLHHRISEHLYPAYEILVEQVQRAVTYEQSRGRMRCEIDESWSADSVLRLFAKLPEIRRLLNSDLIAAYEGDPAAQSIEEVVFSYPGPRALTAHRIAHALYAQGVPLLPRILAEFAHAHTGIDIHAGAEIGESFFIDHGTGVVIGETTRIGNRVKIYQGVTLGALSVQRTHRTADNRAHKRHPTIEDDVTIYSGAKILGGDTVIGANSVIGGNVWLVESVPPNSKIFGRERSDEAGDPSLNPPNSPTQG